MDNRLILTDENGQETEMEIVLTFDDEEHGRKYVLVKYPSKDEDDVFAFAYDDEGNLEPVEDPEEFEMCQEVLGAFEEENNG
jgi:uncharacterized protein YrzB (UPF0473 family)